MWRGNVGGHVLQWFSRDLCNLDPKTTEKRLEIERERQAGGGDNKLTRKCGTHGQGLVNILKQST